LLCQCLSINESPGAIEALRSGLRSAQEDWDRIIEIADEERLAPALWGALKRKGLQQALPAKASGTLKRRYSMNAIWNQKIRDEIAEVIGCLNRAGMVPILLKGGVYLFDPGFDDPGARIMRDVDMLAREDEVEPSAQALFDIGYKVKAGEDLDWSYCYPTLDRVGCVTPVEIHKYVGQQNAVLPLREAWRDAVEIGDGELQVMALSPTHKVFVNVFHAQVQDRGYELGLCWLRQLQDFAEICRRHGESIDWDALRHLMRRHGLEAVLSAQVYLAHRLLGLPIPAEIPAGFRTRLHYQRCLFLLRWPWAMWATRMWAGLTAPFKRYHIALTYGCSLNPIDINLHRLKHVGHILQKYRGSLFTRAWQRRRYDV
jgi:hypothetical protein